MLWRHFRREVTHCKLFETVKALIEASEDFLCRYNKTPEKVLSIIGTHLARLLCLYLVVCLISGYNIGRRTDAKKG